MKRPAIVGEMMALNATAESLLMRQMMAEVMAQKPTDRRGSAVRSSTWERKVGNESSLSRAKDQVYRDVEAREPNEAQVTRTIRIAVITEDPARELVARKNSWMKANPVSLFRAVCRSPKVKEKVT